ncbi:hypothetical protein IVB02_26010 [Bradyrhizobium sp. 166]|uniref:hypothetical protein n=1 Tax=Bradyrhizobium sp. 166 TaxID=2782638 RepID=UPI001FF7B1D5|nr:hypothetical protein [Bradyrhizobium sp. 166]MCK1604764.1 hypothetical protein [Bradyrhizobium sp. 166]
MTTTETPRSPQGTGAKLRSHLAAFGVRYAIAFAVLLVGDGLIFAYVWGGRKAPEMHVGTDALTAIPLAAIIYLAGFLAGSFPAAAWSATIHTPRWSTLEPFFKGSRIVLTVIALSYVLFYVTQGVNTQTGWAVWVDKHVLNFDLLCRHFRATEVIRIEIVGYVLYLILHGIYNVFCPPILAHTIRKRGGLAREDAAFVFVRTIERHGHAIPPSNLANTVAAFATECRGLFDDDTKALLDTRLRQLRETVAGPSGAPEATAATERPAQGPEEGGVAAKTKGPNRDAERGWDAAVVADAAAVARLFPSRLAMETYHLGVDLFDVLYPVWRGALCAGLAVAILATSLPVAAKLVWVAFPRLGERCMADVTQAPPNFRDSEWVEFEGKVDTRGPVDVVLVPEDNANERWTLGKQDVVEISTEKVPRIFLRIGGVVKDVKLVGAPSGALAPPSAPSSRMSIQCGAAGSRCSNNVEICCGSNEIKGRCYGRWPCPSP